MSRKPKSLGSTAERGIERRARRGESPEAIAVALGMPSKARSIRRRVDALLGRKPATGLRGRPPNTKRRAVTPARKAAATPDDRAALEAEVWAAHETCDHERAAKACRSLVVHDDPEVAAELARGETCFADALAASPRFVDGLQALNRPEDLASLARRVTEAGGWEKEQGESEAAFARFVATKQNEAKARAIALLQSAIEIVKAEP